MTDTILGDTHEVVLTVPIFGVCHLLTFSTNHERKNTMTTIPRIKQLMACGFLLTVFGLLLQPPSAEAAVVRRVLRARTARKVVQKAANKNSKTEETPVNSADTMS